MNSETSTVTLPTVFASELLACDLFKGAGVSLADDFVTSAELILLERGHILTRQGDPADCLYIILDGLVEVLAEREHAELALIDVLGPGACVGDLALLLSGPRTATVRALRDSRVVRISGDAFHQLVTQNSNIALRFARMLGERLQRTTHRRERLRPIRAIAVIGIEPDADITDFCENLHRGFDTDPSSTACLSAAEFNRDRVSEGMTRQWFNAQEQRFHFILYRCDAEPTKWTRQCLRQADLVLLVTHDNAAPAPERVAKLERLATEQEPRPLVDLAIVHSAGPPYKGTHRRLRWGNFSSWHHLRANSIEDYARLGRRLLGRANGLVLSGGGARGFAHIGVLQAIQEAGLPIDYVAGTSMGAILGAQFAAGFDLATMIAMNKSAFGRPRGRSDITLPFVALRNGRRTNAMLKGMFGALRIEDLPIPYFCVSSNLTRAETVLHERGRLWLWTRASCAVPGLLPPVRYRGDLLVDGALLDNLPVEAMRARCRGTVIAADVSVAVDFQDRHRAPRSVGSLISRIGRRFGMPHRMPGIAQILTRTVSLSSVRDARTSGSPADLYFHPAVDEISMTDFARLDEIVALGAEHARTLLATWLGAGRARGGLGENAA